MKKTLLIIGMIMALLTQTMPAFAYSFVMIEGDFIEIDGWKSSVDGTIKVNKFEEQFQTIITDKGYILVYDGKESKKFEFTLVKVKKGDNYQWEWQWVLPNTPTDDQREAINKAVLLWKLVSNGTTQCQDSIAAIYDLELKQFQKFLETTFQNKSSNSSLLNLAIARYQNFKDKLNTIFYQISTNSYDTDYVRAQNSYGLCSDIRNEYFEQAKLSMIKHIKMVTSIKTTTIMLEKYQAINSKLRDLNMAISRMYGYFMTFKNILPGFVKKCLTSG